MKSIILIFILILNYYYYYFLGIKWGFSGKLEDSEKELTETKQKTTMKQQDRSALFDITNDSPIVGLAMGIFETPSSAMSKKKVIGRGKLRQESSSINNTPGSGEALLRGQVKTLLQKVEEEAVLSKLTSEQGGPFLHLKGLVNSPMGLVIAPTPANTPQILSLSAQSKELGSPAESPVEDKFLISQVIIILSSHSFKSIVIFHPFL